MATSEGRINIEDLPARAGELTPEDLRKVTGGMDRADSIECLANPVKKAPAKKKPG